MKQSFSNLVETARKQSIWWMYAAATLPFVALAIIISLHFYNLDSWLHNTYLVITITFVATSVLWWWWAINKIVHMLRAMDRTDENFYEIKDALTETRKVVRELNASHRKWRKQENNQP